MNLTYEKTWLEIGGKILKTINYPDDKSKKIVHFISIHDNWTFGESDISPIHAKKPFSTSYTKTLRETYLKEREQELL